MKQTKFLIASLAVALLFLGFSLGYFITNRGINTEINQIAAFASREQLQDEYAVDDASAVTEGTEEGSGTRADADVNATAFEVAADQLPDKASVVAASAAVDVLDNMGDWQLRSLDGALVEDEYVLFAKSGARFGGETPCNAFFGEYGWSAGVTRTEQFGTTGLSCGEMEAIVRLVLAQGIFSYQPAGELLVQGAGHELVFIR